MHCAGWFSRDQSSNFAQTLETFKAEVDDYMIYRSSCYPSYHSHAEYPNCAVVIVSFALVQHFWGDGYKEMTSSVLGHLSSSFS